MSNFVNHPYDYRPNWTPLSPVAITYYKPKYLVTACGLGYSMPSFRPFKYPALFAESFLTSSSHDDDENDDDGDDDDDNDGNNEKNTEGVGVG